MFKMKRKEEKKKELNNYKEFDKILKILLIIGIVIVSSFIIYALLTPKPGYLYIGILNSNKKAENYTKNAAVDENITLYISVGNYLNRVFFFPYRNFEGE